MQDIFSKLEEHQACVLIPTYNNDKFLQSVLDQFKGLGKSLLIINDGSTDTTSEILNQFREHTILEYPDNKGKGHALKLGLQKAEEMGFTYAISMDSDGQHDPKDISKFLDALAYDKNPLIIGSRNLHAENMPGKNSFGNKFSNFWYHVETGIKLSDSQSGFRLYPVHSVNALRLITGHYEFELEVLVKAAWHRIPIVAVPISVYYPPEGERISHFKPFRDFTRISILNTFLVLAGLLFYRPMNLIKDIREMNLREWIKVNIVKPTESIEKKAIAIGLGFFMGIVPVWGYQMILAVVIAHYFKLNKAIVLIASNISIGPMMPFIIYFSFLFGGLFMEEPAKLTMDFDTIDLNVIGVQIWQYIIGSIGLAITAGLLGGVLSYILLWLYKSINTKKV